MQTTLSKLGVEREELGELWTTRKLRLDLCLQLRLFERDALELSAQFEVRVIEMGQIIGMTGNFLS